jgi:hypothetical protein
MLADRCPGVTMDEGDVSSKPALASTPEPPSCTAPLIPSRPPATRAYAGLTTLDEATDPHP